MRSRILYSEYSKNSGYLLYTKVVHFFLYRSSEKKNGVLKQENSKYTFVMCGGEREFCTYRFSE